MVGSAVAAALGLGEQQGRSIDDSVLAANWPIATPCWCGQL